MQQQMAAIKGHNNMSELIKQSALPPILRETFDVADVKSDTTTTSAMSSLLQANLHAHMLSQAHAQMLSQSAYLNMQRSFSGPLGHAQQSQQSLGTVHGRYKEEEEDAQQMAMKRPRLIWTKQLHERFVEAVNKMGVDQAVPKAIMQSMNVKGITRENVASHLQKYRAQLKKNKLSTAATAANVNATTNAPANANKVEAKN